MPQAHYVDTHCHIDLFPDPANLVDTVEQKRIYTIAMTNAPSVFPAMKELAAGKTYVRAALGLHPELATEREGELALFETYLPQTKYVGEIGLDNTRDDSDRNRTQMRVFEKIIELCHLAGGKVLSIHSRRATDDVVASIPGDFTGRVILHWYSGSLKTLKRALARGFFVSANSAMVSSRSGERVLQEVPLGQLLTESDGPFVKQGPRPAEPSDMQSVIRSLSKLRGLDPQETASHVFANFRRLLTEPVGLDE